MIRNATAAALRPALRPAVRADGAVVFLIVIDGYVITLDGYALTL